MKFGMDNWKVLTMQQGRMKHSEGLKLLGGEIMNKISKAGYKYLGILQDDQIRHRETKEKLQEEYVRRVKKLLILKLYLMKNDGRNQRMGSRSHSM